ncbi:MAG: hypothetical protein MJZ19_11570 [Paludibacteraceae bacterium]|nr:hypothetical protein [Paludibacteraceae bacterium]
MKHIQLFLSAVLSAIAVVCSAQDTIVLKNGDEVSAIVSEVLMDEVKYKKASNADGPTYTMPKSNIFMIKFKNGEKEVYSVQPKEEVVGQQTKNIKVGVGVEVSKTTSENNSSPVVYDPNYKYNVTRRSVSGITTETGYYLNEYEAVQLLGQQKFENFSSYTNKMNKGFNLMIAGGVADAISLPMIIVGAIIAADDYYDDPYYNRHDYESAGHILIATGIITQITSWALIPVGVTKFAKNRYRAKKVLKEYNGVPFELNQNDLSLSWGAKGNGLGVSLTF